DATLLGDGRVLVLGHARNTDPISIALHGEIYDPETNTWTPTASVDSSLYVTRIVAEELPDGDVLVLVSHKELDEDAPVFINANRYGFMSQVTALIYSVTTDTWEELVTFDRTDGGLEPDITWLPETGAFLLNLYADWFSDPTSGILFHPQTRTWEPLFEEGPSKGRVMAVFPGDQVLFQSDYNAHLYDVPTGTWTRFDAFPQGSLFSSVVLLSDCYLFASGEIPLYVSPSVLREVDTAYCAPDGQ
ncbi:MAG: hypothetical protein ACNA8W_19195, partial [Bradymonadaceae bacterium]